MCVLKYKSVPNKNYIYNRIKQINYRAIRCYSNLKKSIIENKFGLIISSVNEDFIEEVSCIIETHETNNISDKDKIHIRNIILKYINSVEDDLYYVLVQLIEYYELIE